MLNIPVEVEAIKHTINNWIETNNVGSHIDVMVEGGDDHDIKKTERC